MKSEKKFKRAIAWFRRDLRLNDQRAFSEATHQAEEVMPLFIIDEKIIRYLKPDNRRVSFIEESLLEMQAALKSHGSGMVVEFGDPLTVLKRLIRENQVDAIFYNRDYEPSAIARDESVEKEAGVPVFGFKDQVMFEKREILNGSKLPFRVFTPYSKAWLNELTRKKKEHLRDFAPSFHSLMQARALPKARESFFEHGFKKVKLHFPGGEKEAKRRLQEFASKIGDYGTARDFPAIDGTSTLSPYLRFGCISIRECVRFCDEHLSSGAKVWLNELIWRDFYQMILSEFPFVASESFKPEYRSLKWTGSRSEFKAWCEGRTGYPIVDAAMRQLNETGWMHNRLRMITAMFLVKDLLINWQEGEKYFAEQLIDHDLAANNGGWQWSASTGTDAQPYFRIMNPVLQSEKFDPDGEFIRTWVPELREAPKKAIHWPHEESVFEAYPIPIVDHKAQREKALRLFKK